MTEDINDKFPISKTSPITLITIEDGEIKTKTYNWNYVREKDEFLDATKDLKCKHKLIGAWLGQWSTDVFNLDIDKFRNKLLGGK